jgi:hypothetical protein
MSLIDAMNKVGKVKQISSLDVLHRNVKLPIDGFDIITGHLHFEEYPGAEYITVLRNPVDRVISNYFYALRTREHILHRLARQSLRSTMVSHYVQNLAVRQLCGKGLNYTGDITKQDFDTACNNLKKIKFVGFTENLGEFWNTLSVHYGWNARLQRRNVSPRTHKVSSEDRQLIKEHNMWDILLYMEAKA